MSLTQLSVEPCRTMLNLAKADAQDGSMLLRLLPPCKAACRRCEWPGVHWLANDQKRAQADQVSPPRGLTFWHARGAGRPWQPQSAKPAGKFATPIAGSATCALPTSARCSLPAVSNAGRTAHMRGCQTLGREPLCVFKARHAPRPCSTRSATTMTACPELVRSPCRSPLAATTTWPASRPF